MRYSKETKKEHRALIRRIIVVNPDASILEIQRTLKKQDKPFDRAYITKHYEAIKGERAKRLDHQTVNIELAKFEDLVEAIATELWKVINNPDDDKSKIMAAKELIKSHDTLFDKKFDAGIFTRKLGEQMNKYELDENDKELVDNFLDKLDELGHRPTEQETSGTEKDSGE